MDGFASVLESTRDLERIVTRSRIEVDSDDRRPAVTHSYERYVPLVPCRRHSGQPWLMRLGQLQSMSLDDRQRREHRE